jgi:hypothetical protein
MDLSFSKKNSIYLLSFLLMVAASCSSYNEKSEEKVESEVLTVAEKELELVKTGLQQIPSWVSYWKGIEPEFNPDDFSFARGFTYEKLEWPEENHIVPGSDFYPYLVYHPEKEGVVDLYSYKVAYNENGKPYFNPDSEVIYFKNDGMRERLMFIGPSGAFEEAVWVSSEHLLVAGNFEEEGGVRPMLWLIFPKENRYLNFESSILSKHYTTEEYLKKKLNKIDF